MKLDGVLDLCNERPLKLTEEAIHILCGELCFEYSDFNKFEIDLNMFVDCIYKLCLFLESNLQNGTKSIIESKADSRLVHSLFAAIERMSPSDATISLDTKISFIDHVMSVSHLFENAIQQEKAILQNATKLELSTQDLYLSFLNSRINRQHDVVPS